jgi:hypothetical protein
LKKKMLRAMGIWADVPESQFFMLQDGRVIKNLPELQTAFEEMSDETFRHHVNSRKNDFANWVRDVLGDRELAAELTTTPNKLESGRIVAKKIEGVIGGPVLGWSPIFKPPIFPF